MRYTKKDESFCFDGSGCNLHYVGTQPLNINIDEENIDYIEGLFNKLGLLEDVEDEWGVELKIFISLFKIKGIYVKSGYCCETGKVDNLNSYQNIEWINFEISSTSKDFANNWQILFYVKVSEYESTLYAVNIKDYGKTWSFAKEELL